MWTESAVFKSIADRTVVCASLKKIKSKSRAVFSCSSGCSDLRSCCHSWFHRSHTSCGMALDDLPLQDKSQPQQHHRHSHSPLFHSIRTKPWRLEWHDALETKLQTLSPPGTDVAFAPLPASHVDLATLIRGGGTVYTRSDKSSLVVVQANAEDAWDSRCHDAAHILRHLPVHKGASIITGVALGAGSIWRPHSWLVHMNGSNDNNNNNVCTTAPPTAMATMTATAAPVGSDVPTASSSSSSSSPLMLGAAVPDLDALAVRAPAAPPSLVLYELTQSQHSVYYGKLCDCKDCLCRSVADEKDSSRSSPSSLSHELDKLDKLIAQIVSVHPAATHARLLRDLFAPMLGD